MKVSRVLFRKPRCCSDSQRRGIRRSPESYAENKKAAGFIDKYVLFLWMLVCRIEKSVFQWHPMRVVVSTYLDIQNRCGLFDNGPAFPKETSFKLAAYCNYAIRRSLLQGAVASPAASSESPCLEFFCFSVFHWSPLYYNLCVICISLL